MLAYGVPDTETARTEIVMCTLVVYMMCSVVCKEKKMLSDSNSCRVNIFCVLACRPTNLMF